MTSYEALSFVLAFWQEVEETQEAMADELSSYGEDFQGMAQEYAQCVLDDHEEWSTDWIKRAKDVQEAVV